MHFSNSNCLVSAALPVQATPFKDLGSKLDPLTKRTQDGGTEVVQAKAGKVGLPHWLPAPPNPCLM